MAHATDFAVVGGGIVGLTIAREIARRRLGSVAVLDKEPELGRHASGRNSGVLHAGIYYKPGSLRARVCVEGAREMFAWAQDNGVRVVRTGKVIVATTPDAAPRVEELHERATANGVRTELIDGTRLAELEPRAHSHGIALWSPETAVIDSRGALERIRAELEGLGVAVRCGFGVGRVDVAGRRIESGGESHAYGHLINAAGAWADRLALEFGVGEQYRFIPFKGRYKELTAEAARDIRGSIYPAPDPRFPFLGVHVTRSVDDEVLIGPTATPAFGRENYGLLEGVDAGDLPRLLVQLAGLYSANRQGFRGLVHEELRRYTRQGFADAVRALVPSIRPEDLRPSHHVGIRPQLIDRRERKLVMDFVVEQGPSSTHVLNAISPAFTAGFAFARVVVDQLEGNRPLDAHAS